MLSPPDPGCATNPLLQAFDGCLQTNCWQQCGLTPPGSGGAGGGGGVGGTGTGGAGGSGVPTGGSAASGGSGIPAGGSGVTGGSSAAAGSSPAVGGSSTGTSSGAPNKPASDVDSDSGGCRLASERIGGGRDGVPWFASLLLLGAINAVRRSRRT